MAGAGFSTAAALNDSDLLRYYQWAGDESAFAALVERYQAMVLGTAYRRTGNFELARDVAQEVFAALSQKARFLLGRASVGGWLHRAALYESVHAVQSETRRRARQERFFEGVDQVVPPVVGNSSIPEAVSLVDEALEALPAADREALVLRYFQDLSYEEMAQTLGVSEAAVRQRVSRSLERLGKSLTARGVTSSAVAVLLAAVAVQSTVAVPAGLAAAALSAAAASASSSAFLFLWTIVPTVATKTAAGLIAVAGATILWQLAVPARPVLHESAGPNSAVMEYRVDVPPANLPSARQAPAQEARTQLAPNVVGVRRLPAPGKAIGGKGVRRGGGRNRPATVPDVPDQPRALSAERPMAGSSLEKAPIDPAGSSLRKVPIDPAIGPDSGGPAPEVALAASDLGLTGALAAAVETHGLPNILDELRRSEPFPAQAAEVASRLVEDALVLDERDKARLKDHLSTHYQHLNAEGLAGAPPPLVPEDEWRAKRGPVIADTVSNVQGALGPAVPEPKVIADVLTLVDKADAWKSAHARSDMEDEWPPGRAVADAVKNVQGVGPAVPESKVNADVLTLVDKADALKSEHASSDVSVERADAVTSQVADSNGKAPALRPAAAAARSESLPSVNISRGVAAAPPQIGR